MDEVQVATAKAVQAKRLRAIAHAKTRAEEGIKVLQARIEDHRAQMLKLDEEAKLVAAQTFEVTDEAVTAVTAEAANEPTK